MTSIYIEDDNICIANECGISYYPLYVEKKEVLDNGEVIVKKIKNKTLELDHLYDTLIMSEQLIN